MWSISTGSWVISALSLPLLEAGWNDLKESYAEGLRKLLRMGGCNGVLDFMCGAELVRGEMAGGIVLRRRPRVWLNDEILRDCVCRASIWTPII